MIEFNSKDYLSIAEFSEITGLPQSTLRYYHDKNIFPPAAVGENQYRYYSPEQIISVNFIKVLLELGLPIKKISEYQSERDPNGMVSVLFSQIKEINKQIRMLTDAYAVIQVFQENIITGVQADPESLSVQRLDEGNIRFGGVNNFSQEKPVKDSERPSRKKVVPVEKLTQRDNETAFYAPFSQFCINAKKYGINLSFPTGGHWGTFFDYIKSANQPEKFFSLDPFGYDTRPAGDYLVGYSKGFYGKLSNLPERFVDYAKEHRLQFVGGVYSTYIHDEVSVKNPDEYLMQTIVQVEG
jgi:DNA-binding transcriptional MerR regulator